jgi:peroxiredoxin
MKALRCVVLVVAAALVGCAGNQTEPEPRGPRPPAPAPTSKLRRYAFKAEAPSNRPVDAPLPGEDAELTAPDGRIARISDYRGRPVVLVFNRGFVGYVCPFCTTYTAQLATRYDEIRALGGELLLVYPTRETDEARVLEFTDAVNEILTEEGQGALPFPVFLDRGLAATIRFNLTGDITKPSTFVLGRDGVVRYAHVGDDPEDRPSVDRVMQELQAIVESGS